MHSRKRLDDGQAVDHILRKAGSQHNRSHFSVATHTNNDDTISRTNLLHILQTTFLYFPACLPLHT